MMPSALTEELAAVLRTVALADLCEPSTIAKAHGHAVAEQLDQLHAAGLVMRQGARRFDRTRTTLYTISTTGRDRLQAYDAGFRHRITAGTTVPVMAAARTAHLTTRGLYTGAELQPYDGRPGAMDAFALPSRMGNRLHYRDGRVQQLYAVPGRLRDPRDSRPGAAVQGRRAGSRPARGATHQANGNGTGAMCGNSVAPTQAEGLVRANFAHETQIYRRVAV